MKRLFLPILLLATVTSCNKNGDDPGTTACRLNTSPYYFQLGGARLQLPNAFTPNGDGRNDYFRPVGATGIQSFSMVVYDHDGSILFQTQDQYTQGWDGFKGGSPVAGGYYSVRLQFTTANGDAADRQECVALCTYNSSTNCITRSSYGFFYFEDMLDPGDPNHYFGTGEYVCP